MHANNVEPYPALTEHATPDLPAFSRKLKRWCRWKLTAHHGGRPTKVPDQSTRLLDACRELHTVQAGGLDAQGGIGLVFTGRIVVDTPRGKATVVLLDLDACRDPLTGEIAPWALRILERYHWTFTEISPSGTGLHVFIAVLHLPEGLRAKVRLDELPMPNVGEKRPELQLFGRGAPEFVALSMRRLARCPGPVTVDEDLSWLIDEFGLEADSVSAELPVGTGHVPTLNEITAAVSALPGGPALIAGRWQEVTPNASASEAYHRLVRDALHAANYHGILALNWLLERTAWGHGQIEDSADPSKYERAEWVERDLLRAAAKVPPSPSSVFEPLPDLPPPPPKPGRLISHLEFLRRREDQLFLVDQLVPRTGLVQVFGDPGTGKTPFAMGLALRVAGSVERFFDREVDRHGTVVYLVGEDSNGLGWRAEATQQALGIDPALLDQRLLWSTEPGRLSDAEDVARWAQEIRQLHPEGIALMVIDTQSRNFGDGDENSSQDMARFVGHLAMLAATLRCCIVLVHHTGLTNKDRARGSSVMFAAIDASFEIQKVGSLGLRVVPGKAKNWEKPSPFEGHLAVVQLGLCGKGRPRTAITLVDHALAHDAPESIEGALRGLAGDAPLRRLLVAIAEHELLNGDAPLAYDELSLLADVRVDAIKRGMIANLVALGLIEVVQKAAGRKAGVYKTTVLGDATLREMS